MAANINANSVKDFGKFYAEKSRSARIIEQLYGFDDNFSWAEHIESLDAEVRLNALNQISAEFDYAIL